MDRWLPVEDRIQLRKTKEGQAALELIRELNEQLINLILRNEEKDTFRCPPPENI